ncbi:MAG: PorT family protein [Bacteroidales bacterium]|nr:PorT family protein [Bacteroidales bacterium]
MFDDNKYTESDNLMRSILSQAQEDVPEHIWAGVASELDRIQAVQTVRPVKLWFRRSAIAVAAAAAVAVGVFTDRNNGSDIIPDSYDRSIIAVADSPKIIYGDQLTDPSAITEKRIKFLADADDEVQEAVSLMETVIEEEKTGSPVQPEHVEVPAPKEITEPEQWDETWMEDDYGTSGRKAKTSIVLSGVAGTNSTQNNPTGMLRRPSMSTSRPKTGVEQKSSESVYGLPLSVGAGVKIDFNERWALGIGANYTLLTRKFFGTYTSVDGNGNIDESVSSDIRNAQQYVGIPVNVFYNIANKDYINFYAYAGGTVERCISDKYDILNTNFIYKGAVKGVQFSADIGIGVEFLLGRYLGLYVDPSLRYYFDCNQPKSIRTAQPFMLGLEMGLRIKL